MNVADNLARIKETLGASSVKLVAVSKNVTPSVIETAYRLGITEFGENRVQDALRKRQEIDPEIEKKINWHFVGRLQSNKARQAVGNFELIHSIDSLRLAKEVSAAAIKKGLTQSVLLQVKLMEDPGKTGFAPQVIADCFEELNALPGIAPKGLMTIAPLSTDPAAWHQCFDGLRCLRDSLERRHSVRLSELSMGMSQDWCEAIKCGATIIRLGRALFGV